MTRKCHCGRRAVWVVESFVQLKKNRVDLCGNCAWDMAADKVLIPIEVVYK
tara:strand:+ start:1096 stop:1248 length:153 start_codon:yes stop_codon:yes gene_type:complete